MKNECAKHVEPKKDTGDGSYQEMIEKNVAV